MSVFQLFDIAASGLQAQSVRMNTIASNLANAHSATSSNGQPYRARQVVFQTASLPGADGMASVKVGGIVEDPSPARLQYDPHHPLADANGYVAMPNVDVIQEMVNMVSASRSIQTQIEMLNTAKALAQRLLQLGQ